MAAAPSSNHSPSFEPWMLSNVITGAVMAGFVTLLIPPFVTSVTGSAARAGVAFSLISLAATLGPVFGRLADRTGAYRVVYTLAFVGMAAGFAVLALDANSDTYTPIASLLIGASIAAKGTVGSALVVGSGLSRAVQAKQLTVYNLLTFPGQIVGAGIVALLHALDTDYATQFWSVAAFIAAASLVVWWTTEPPQRRIRTATSARVAAERDGDSSDVPRLLGSGFVAFMVTTFLVMAAFAAISSQIANIMPAVFDLGIVATSGLVALAGLAGIPAVILAGAWLGRDGSAPPFRMSVVIRVGGALAMAAAGAAAGGAAIAVLASAGYVLMMTGNAVQRSVMPRVAVRLLPRAGEANGYAAAAGASGGFVGCIAAGAIADQWSFELVLWVAAVVAALSLVPLPRVLRHVRAARDADETLVHTHAMGSPPQG